MEQFLIRALQFIAALGLLIVIHEFGHYLFARLFGIRVDKFYLFFDWKWALLRWKPKKKQKAADTKEAERPTWRDTEYGIGWIPLGGYCKINGMVDESLDTDALKQEPKPWEFRTKPAWQRLLVMFGGVLFNFILAIVIYAGIAMKWGEQYIPFDCATEGFDYVPAAQAVGFRNGDIPYAADGVRLDAGDRSYPLKMAQARRVTVIRDGRKTDIKLPDNFVFRLNDDKGFLAYRVPVVVDRVVSGEAAEKAGLRVGDHIVAIDTTATPSYSELTPALEKHASRPTTVTVERDGRRLTLPVTPNEYGKLGFQLRPITDVYRSVTREYGPLQAIPKGVEIGTSTLGNYVSSMKMVFTKEGAESLGGFGAIGGMFPDRWNWFQFWSTTAFLSVVLAFMNIIPIPGLDGGHILFLLAEVVSRRKMPENFLIGAQYVGMAFLLLLLIYANANDVYRAFFK